MCGECDKPIAYPHLTSNGVMYHDLYVFKKDPNAFVAKWPDEFIFGAWAVYHNGIFIDWYRTKELAEDKQRSL